MVSSLLSPGGAVTSPWFSRLGPVVQAVAASRTSPARARRARIKRLSRLMRPPSPGWARCAARPRRGSRRGARRPPRGRLRPPPAGGGEIEARGGDDPRLTAGQGGEGGRGDQLHGGDPDAGEDQREGERQLHVPQHLAAAHAHAPGGPHDVPVHLAHPHVGVGEQRRHGEQDERDDRRPLAVRAHGGEQQQDEDGEGGDGPADVGDVDGERTALAEMTEDQGDGQRDQAADEQADDGEIEVFAVPDPVGTGPVGGGGEPGPGVGERLHHGPLLASRGSAAAALPGGAHRRRRR
ncbi:hypothetical protein SMICM17S_09676 [Streptomyces microflavus]